MNRSNNNGAFLLSSIAAAVAVGGACVVWWKNRESSKGLYDDDDEDEASGAGNNRGAGTEDHLKLPPHLERELAKDARRKQMMYLFTMKRPMYDNIFMHDPRGKKLCTISKRKADWYVRKGLAVWKEEDTIYLTFEPQSSGDKDPLQASYNKTPKLNVCVICGAGQEYMRHYVVPYCYRSQFPRAYKTHLSHDVVLTCPTCHVEAERSAHKRMRQLERDLRRRWKGDVQLETEAPFHVDPAVHKLVSSAQALLKWKHKLPEERIQEYTELLQGWVGETPLTEQHLEAALQLDDKKPNPEYISGPDLVLEWLKKDNDWDTAMAEFIRTWRSQFLETMQPRHLPVGWSIGSPVRCDTRGNSSEQDKDDDDDDDVDDVEDDVSTDEISP